MKKAVLLSGLILMVLSLSIVSNAQSIPAKETEEDYLAAQNFIDAFVTATHTPGFVHALESMGYQLQLGPTLPSTAVQPYLQLYTPTGIEGILPVH